MGVYTQAVQQLYVAYFNRPADAGGLQYWEGVVAAQNGDTSAISAAFASSAEYQAAYQGLSNSQIVNQVYMNLFGREAEPDGRAYWTDLLDRRAITIDNVVTTVGRGAQGTDDVAYKAKVSAATAFTAGLTTPEQIAAYDGPVVNQVLKGFISAVIDANTLALATSFGSLLRITENVVAVHKGATSSIAYLTNASDSLQPGGNTPFSGNETFIATSATFNPGDRVDGGAGSDILNLRVAGSSPYVAPGNVAINNIETVNITANATVNVDTRGWTGLTKLSDFTRGGTQLVAAATTQLTVNDRALAAGQIRVDGGSSLDLTASELTSGSITVGASAAVNGPVSVTSNIKAGSKAGSIAVTGGTDIFITQNRASAPDSIQAGAVLVNGNAATQSVLVNNGNFEKGNNSVKITDSLTLAGQTGHISKVTVVGATDISITDNALSILNVATATGTIRLDNAGLTTANQKSSLTLNLAGKSTIQGFVDVNNNLKQLEINGGSNGFPSNVDNSAIVKLADIHSASLQTLAINGNGLLALGLAGAPALTNISLKGIVGVTLDASHLAVTKIDASQGSGSSNLTLNGNTSFVGNPDNSGLADDRITVVGEAVRAVIQTGGGNDTVILRASAFADAGQIDGGRGTDSLQLTTRSAVDWAANPDFQTRVSGFETLILDNSDAASAAQSVNLAGLGNFSAVSVKGNQGLTLNNWNSDSTLYLTASAASYGIANPAFASGSSDTLKLGLAAGSSEVAGNPVAVSISVPDVEMANITVGGKDLKSLTLVGGSLTDVSFKSTFGGELVVNDATLTKLTLGNSIGVVKFTAGQLNNNLTISTRDGFGSFAINTAASTHGLTFLGGDGTVDLTLGSGSNQIAVPGMGGSVALSNTGTDLISYTTLSQGGFRFPNSSLKLTFADHGTETFNSSKVVLGASATLADYANAAAHQGGNGSTHGVISWFQFQRDTYLVETRHDASAADAGFASGTDILVKIVGLVDLQRATLSGATGSTLTVL